jgi:hypothetical protein
MQAGFCFLRFAPLLLLSNTVSASVIVSTCYSNANCSLSSGNYYAGFGPGFEFRASVGIPNPYLNQYYSISAHQTVTVDLTTEGPIRPGYVELWYSAAHGGISIANLFDYQSGTGSNEQTRGVRLPFTLGIPFQIQLASTSNLNNYYDYSWIGHATISGRIIDPCGYTWSNGWCAETFVSPLDAPAGSGLNYYSLPKPTDVPEPAGLAAGGLLMLGLYRVLRRR